MSINLPVLNPDKNHPDFPDGLYIYSEDNKPVYALNIIRHWGVYYINKVEVYTDTLPSSIVIPTFPTRSGEPFDTTKDVNVVSKRATFSLFDQRYTRYADGYVCFSKDCFKDFENLDIIIPEDTTVQIHPQAFKPNSKINFITVKNKTFVDVQFSQGIYDDKEIRNFIQGTKLETYRGDIKRSHLLLADNIKMDVKSESEHIVCTPIKDTQSVTYNPLNPNNVQFTINKTSKIEDDNIVQITPEGNYGFGG